MNDKSNKISVGRGVAELSANISIINVHVFPDTSRKEVNEHIYNIYLRHLMRYLMRDLVMGDDFRSVLSCGAVGGEGH